MPSEPAELRLSDDLAAIRQELGRLVQRVEALEAAAEYRRGATEARPTDQLDEELVLTISAAVAAYLGKGSCIPYAASKAAINNLTVALARTFAPQIRVNAVAPGFISGRWLEQGLGEAYQRMKRSYEQRLPSGRICDPEDVAATVFGMIGGPDLVTGQTVVVDGGMLIADWNA